MQICYIHGTSSESSTIHKSTEKLTKEKNKASAKNAGSNTGKKKEFNKNANGGTTLKDKNKKPTKDSNGRPATKDKSKVHMKDASGSDTKTKAKRSPQSLYQIMLHLHLLEIFVSMQYERRSTKFWINYQNVHLRHRH